MLDKLYDEEEVLLRMRAPTIQAVLDKLLIMWDEDLPCGCEESKQQRVVIRDLRRLVKLHSPK